SGGSIGGGGGGLGLVGLGRSSDQTTRRLGWPLEEKELFRFKLEDESLALDYEFSVG
ncbi:hypothetical protein TorRG33x02_101160, partial [Trema orientale]